MILLPAVVFALVFEIRPARIEDCDDIASMIVKSVSSLGQSYYEKDQIQAWHELLPSPGRVKEMLQEQDRMSWVATVFMEDHDDDIGEHDPNTEIVGYIDWKPSQNELDFLYVHPLYARQGVASQLYQKVLQEALTNDSTSSLIIQTFASEGAMPFFEKQDFSVVERREFAIGSNQILIHNYKMELCRKDLLVN